MKKTVTALCALALAAALASLLEVPTGANTALNNAFNSRYGPALTTQFGCSVCHPAASFSELNPYGEDMLEAIIGGDGDGGCQDFFPPNTHTIAKGRCEYLHAQGLNTPFSSGCTVCHGVDLNGLIAPSCFLCHGQRWTEAGPGSVSGGVAPTADTTPTATATATSTRSTP